MDYYTEKQRANHKISQIINMARKNKTDLEINNIIFSVTEQFKVGEKSVLKRIYLIRSVDQDFDIIDDKTIVFK